MSKFSDYVTTVTSKINAIAKTYFEDVPPFLNTTDSNNYAYKLINFESFITTNSLTGNVYAYINNNLKTVTNSSFTEIKNGSGKLDDKVQDIYLGDMITAVQGTGDHDFKKHLQDLYVWYDVLSEDNWNAATSSTKGKYPGNARGVETNVGLIDTVETLKASSKFNPFIARRMVRLMILLGNLNIAIKNGNITLINLCFQLLQRQNFQIDDTANGVNAALGDVVQQSVKNYKDNVENVESLAKRVKEQQTNYTVSAQLLKDIAEKHKTERVYEYIALAVFLFIAVATAVVLIFPMEQKQKIMGCSILVILSVVNAFVLNYIKKSNTKIEGFYDYTTGDKNAVSSYELAAIKEASAYIDNTYGLAHMLETYRAYGNLNNAIGKDIGYYYNASRQLQIANKKVQGINNTSYTQDVQFAALMDLMGALTIIVAGMAALQVGTASFAEKMPIIPKVIIGTGATLATASFTYYILQTTFRVHTKPSQYYWNQPDTNMF